MKTFKREIKQIEKSANKILEVCSLMKIAMVKPPKAIKEQLEEINTIDQDIAEDKVHEEEQVVSPQQEELDNSGIVPEEGNEV